MSDNAGVDMQRMFRNVGLAELLKIGAMVAIGAVAWQRAQDKYDLLSARVDAVEHASGERSADMGKRLDHIDGRLDEIQRDLLNMTRGYQKP